MLQSHSQSQSELGTYPSVSLGLVQSPDGRGAPWNMVSMLNWLTAELRVGQALWDPGPAS